MKLTIEDLRGTWRAQIDHRSEFADTLEELLLKLAPSAPPDAVWSAAEVLGAILGAEVVEIPQAYGEAHIPSTEEDWGALFDAFLASPHGSPLVNGDEDEPIDGLAEAVQEYTDPDEYPRGV